MAKPSALRVQVTAELNELHVGRIVHYVSHGTPILEGGTQAYTSQCRAAIITEAPNADLTELTELVADVSLCILNPMGTNFVQGVQFHDGAQAPGAADCAASEVHGAPFRYCACGWAEASHRGGTWHWAEHA